MERNRWLPDGKKVSPLHHLMVVWTFGLDSPVMSKRFCPQHKHTRNQQLTNFKRQIFSRKAPTQPAKPSTNITPPTNKIRNTGSKPCRRVIFDRSDSTPWKGTQMNKDEVPLNFHVGPTMQTFPTTIQSAASMPGFHKSTEKCLSFDHRCKALFSESLASFNLFK